MDVTSHTTLSTRPSPERGQLVAGLAKPAFVVVGDDDVGTLGQRTPGGRRADAGAGGGRHDDDLAVQKAVSGNLFRRIGAALSLRQRSS